MKVQERIQQKLQKAKQVAEVAAEKTQTAIQPASEVEPKEIVYNDWTGNSVRLSPSIIRNLINPKANLADIWKFIHTCRSYKLNPFIGDAYLVKYDEREPAQIIVSRFVFMRVAQQQPEYRGFTSGVIVTRTNPDKKRSKFADAVEDILKAAIEKAPEAKAELLELILKLKSLEETLSAHDMDVLEIEGAFVPPGWTLYGGWCVVFVQDETGETRQVIQRVLLSEYNREKASWKVMPATMIQKVAEAQAFRKAFPNALSGLYIPEEMGVEKDEIRSAQVVGLQTQARGTGVDEGVEAEPIELREEGSISPDETE
jgi:phage recombination protein Bet